jgi:mRNA (guanine-N7-)-methyltransferase
LSNNLQPFQGDSTPSFQPSWQVQNAPTSAATIPRSSNLPDDEYLTPKVDPTPMLNPSLMVASAYDSLKDVGVEGRKQSNLLHLKNFNNWIKATLISNFVPSSAKKVLDLACGKLGDLKKWYLNNISTYCGIDISKTGIFDARNRFNEMNSKVFGNRMKAKLARVDLGCTNLFKEQIIHEKETFDVISIQFALHYLFQSETRALTFFQNIAKLLPPGGIFLGTIPDANVLIRNLRNSTNTTTTKADDESIKSTTVSFGNDLFRITFPPESIERQFNLGDNPYGLRYSFYLEEAVENIDEYLVPLPLLERLGNAIGLELIESSNFHEFYSKMKDSPENQQLLQSMRVFNFNGTLSNHEWQVASMYRTFVFRKRASNEASLQSLVHLPPLEELVEETHNNGEKQKRYVNYSTMIPQEDILDYVI